MLGACASAVYVVLARSDSDHAFSIIQRKHATHFHSLLCVLGLKLDYFLITFDFSHRVISNHFSDMAKGKLKTIAIKLVSAAQTGFFYTTRKNPKRTPHKLAFRKYDPVVRQHVLFTESKLR